MAAGHALDLILVALAVSWSPAGAAQAAIWPFVVAGLAVAIRRLFWRGLARLLRPPRLSVLLVGDRAANARSAMQLHATADDRITIAGTVELRQQGLAELVRLLHSTPIDCVIATTSDDGSRELQPVLDACETEGVELWVLADSPRPQIARSGIDRLGDTPMMTFRSTPEPSMGMAAKRVVDVMVALPALLVLGLLLILPAAIAIKLTTRGPLFFGQRRLGRRGRPFTMWKLRSMVVNAERIQVSLAAANDVDGPVFKMKKDPRVTSIGRILRKLSIDELPQLWNVVKGEMSLVGPRPGLPSEIAKYEPWQRRRLSVAPGLTCVWQTSGRNKIGFDQWMRMDLAYIDSWSLWQDVWLLLKTVPVVLTGYGAS